MGAEGLYFSCNAFYKQGCNSAAITKTKMSKNEIWAMAFTVQSGLSLESAVTVLYCSCLRHFTELHLIFNHSHIRKYKGEILLINKN